MFGTRPKVIPCPRGPSLRSGRCGPRLACSDRCGLESRSVADALGCFCRPGVRGPRSLASLLP
eukprot:7980676-Alexandrium_andersonii.AAC.1